MYELYTIKIIPLGTCFECKSSGILLVACNTYFVGQVDCQSSSQNVCVDFDFNNFITTDMAGLDQMITGTRHAQYA